MEITLYNNFSKRANSTKLPNTTSKRISCTLKSPTSIESPVFVLSDYDTSYNYVQWGNYYYFINDIVFLHNNLYEIHCITDVLATYRAQILASTQFVERSASKFDEYINDNLLSQKQTISNENIVTTDITQFNTSGCYLVRIVNSTGSSSGIATYALTINQLNNLMNIAFNTDTYLDTIVDASILSIFNPMEYIVSIMWFPFSVDYVTNTTTLSKIRLGWWETEAYGCIVPNTVVGKGFNIDVSLGEHQNYFGDFRDYNPNFTNVKLWIPTVGLIEANPMDLEHGLRIRYVCDFVTGMADIFLIDGNARTFSQLQGVIGVPVQIGQAVTDVGSVITGIASAVGNAVAGNVFGAVTGAVSAVQNVLDKTISTIGQYGNITTLIAYRNIGVYYTRFGTCDYPTEVAGRPLMQNTLLSTLSGYVQCGNASIDIPGLGAEKEEVNAMLNSGFYIE